MDRWMYGWTVGGMFVWTDEWTDGWIDRRMDG
jgi:hypothetical protein